MSFMNVPRCTILSYNEVRSAKENRCLEQVTDGLEQKILNIMIPDSSAILEQAYDHTYNP